jgi:predicted MPP superfamily phosphohydrolase
MMRKRGIELLCAVARPPQECWSIRERINFRIALARYIVLLKHEPDIAATINPNSLSLLHAGTTKYVQSFTPYTTILNPAPFV